MCQDLCLYRAPANRKPTSKPFCRSGIAFAILADEMHLLGIEMLSDELACSSLVMRIAERGDLVKTKTKREKVVAEITATHLMKLMQEQGRFLDQQQAVAFFNEGDRAYVMWKQMMYAGENYIKSVLAQTPRPKPICRTPALRPELEASQMSR